MKKLLLASLILPVGTLANDTDPAVVPEDENDYSIVQTKITSGNNYNSPEAIRENGGLKIYYHTTNGIYKMSCSLTQCGSGESVLSKGNLSFIGDPSVIVNGSNYFMFLTGVQSGQTVSNKSNQKLYVSTSNGGQNWSTPQLLSQNHHQPAALLKDGQIYVYAFDNADEEKLDRLTVNSSGTGVNSTNTVTLGGSTIYGYQEQPHIRYNSSDQTYHLLLDRISSFGLPALDYFRSTDGLDFEVFLGRAVEAQDGDALYQSTTDPNDFETTFFIREDSAGNKNIYWQDLDIEDETAYVDPALTTEPEIDPVQPPEDDNLTQAPAPPTDLATDPLGQCPGQTEVLRCGTNQTIDFSPRVDANGCYLPPRCVDLNTPAPSPTTSQNSDNKLGVSGPALFLNFNTNPFKNTPAPDPSFEEYFENEVAPEFGLLFGNQNSSEPSENSTSPTNDTSLAEDTKSTQSASSSTSASNAQNTATSTQTSSSRSSRITSRGSSRSLFSRIQALRNKNSNNATSSTQSTTTPSAQTTSDDRVISNREKAMKSTRTSNRYQFYTRRTATANSRTVTSRRQQSQVYSGYKVYEN